MEIQDAFEQVVKGDLGQKKEEAPAEKKEQPMVVPSLVEEEKQSPPAKSQQPEPSFGQKAASIIGMLTSKVKTQIGALLPAKKEGFDEDEHILPEKAKKGKKNTLFTIEDETASLKPNESTSPTTQPQILKKA